MFLAQKKTAKRANNNIERKLFSLLQGKKEPAKIDSNVLYRELVEKPENKQLHSDGTYITYISIPNSEISSVYKKEIMDYLIDRGALDISTADIISESLYANDNTSLQKAIKEYIFKTISFYDKNIEGFHHGLVLGLVAIIDNRYNIKSNRESGKGRYGVCLKPKITLIQVSLLKLNIRYD